MAGKYSPIYLISAIVMVLSMNSLKVLANPDDWYNIGPGSKGAINRVDVIQNLPEPANESSTISQPDTPIQPTKPTSPSAQTVQPGQVEKPITPGLPGTSGQSSTPGIPANEQTAVPAPTVIAATPALGTPVAEASTTTNESKVITMADFVAVGCYRDSYMEPRPLPKLIVDLRDDSKNASKRHEFNNTILACAQNAFKLGFGFFGIQSEGECWSGDNAEKTYKRDGASIDCHHGVGRSGSNFVYKFIGAYAKPCKDCGPPRAMCFPASATVSLKTGDAISMDNLNIGDEIQTLDPLTNQIIPSEVIAFLHRDASRGLYRVIEAEDGIRIVLSDKHLMYSGKTIHFMRMISADAIKPGDFVISGKKTSKVTKVKTMYGNGIYAPMTRHGSMLVNGVYVSCYAHWNSHEVAHQVMAPLRLWYDFSNVMTNIASSVGIIKSNQRRFVGQDSFQGIHIYADLLLKLLRYLPSNISDMLM